MLHRVAKGNVGMHNCDHHCLMQFTDGVTVPLALHREVWAGRSWLGSDGQHRAGLGSAETLW